jgi:hypothetical protein
VMGYCEPVICIRVPLNTVNFLTRSVTTLSEFFPEILVCAADQHHTCTLYLILKHSLRLVHKCTSANVFLDCHEVKRYKPFP